MREVQEYLPCGLIEHGCVLLSCESCGKSLLDERTDERTDEHAAQPAEQAALHAC